MNEQGDVPHPKHSHCQSTDSLIPLVYTELRRLARSRLKDDAAGRSMDATGLVHDAFVRLSKNGDNLWNSRGHFFAAAAEAMRRILIEKARQRQTQKRGGNVRAEELHGSVIEEKGKDRQLLQLHDALDSLEAIDARKADLVKMKYFIGMTNDEIASALQVHKSTVARDWVYVRAWLKREMES